MPLADGATGCAWTDRRPNRVSSRYNLRRGRPSISVESQRGVGPALDLIERAEIVIEGFRPGVMERMGLGPEACLARNPALVYGRMTGWGQDGPLSRAAGHDLNYIAITGALDAIGRAGGPPTPPLNLVGDFGGGALYLAFGLLAALTSAPSTGRGQVVDAAMVDGAASLMTTFFGLQAAGLYRSERGTNVLDSGAPYYDVYECCSRWPLYRGRAN
jgi:crotonobetainyl-CoA:carnitine CoA-transferase CaiB-like acyl-CoA transferase